MDLAYHWQLIEEALPEDWSDVQLALAVADEPRFERASTLLGPLTPGRVGRELRFRAARDGSGPSAGALGRALARLDDEHIGGKLRILSGARAPTEAPAAAERTLAEGWDAEVATLPSDWSDVYGEVELTSSDHLDPAALAMAPLNPSRFGVTPGFRFRCARRSGYGASPGMVRRCLSRLDEQGIPGEVHILRSLSDTKHVGTQGPVWYVGGKVV